MSTFENYSTYEVKKDPVVTPEIKKETAEQLKKAEEAKKVTRLAEEAKKAEEAKLADTILDNATK